MQLIYSDRNHHNPSLSIPITNTQLLAKHRRMHPYLANLHQPPRRLLRLHHNRNPRRYQQPNRPRKLSIHEKELHRTGPLHKLPLSPRNRNPLLLARNHHQRRPLSAERKHRPRNSHRRRPQHSHRKRQHLRLTQHLRLLHKHLRPQQPPRPPRWFLRRRIRRRDHLRRSQGRILLSQPRQRQIPDYRNRVPLRVR